MATIRRVANSSVPVVAYETALGRLYQGRAEDVLASPDVGLRGKVQLVFTSPPFPLNTKKRYGNLNGDEYVEWLSSFAQPLADALTPDGSIVMELGNAWNAGTPTMSTLPLKALLAFAEAASLHICQQFIANNPARLPGPVQWVNVERIRLKDAYTHVWWMSPTERPKADNRRVLAPYSERMKKLLDRRSYNAGRRPSEHVIGSTSFLRDNGGAIPGSVLSISNTSSGDAYLAYCRRMGLTPHPARMSAQLAEFFIRFLTDVDDLVLDPFAGSNTTGAVAESLNRRWVGSELSEEYIAGSIGRFPGGVMGIQESA